MGPNARGFIAMGIVAGLLVSGGFWLGIAGRGAAKFSGRGALEESALLYARGDAARAVERLQAHLHSNPEDDNARLLLARLYVESGRVREAEEALEELVKRNVQPSATSLLWGRLFRSTGRFDRAERALQSGLKERPSHSGLWRELGFVMKDKGDAAQAISCFYRSLDLDPSQEDLKSLSRELAVAVSTTTPRIDPPRPEFPQGTHSGTPGPTGTRQEMPRPWGSR